MNNLLEQLNADEFYDYLLEEHTDEEIQLLDEAGIVKRAKKFLLRNTKTGQKKLQKASDRAMNRPTVKGWADGQRRINRAKFSEEFNSEELIDFLLAEGHSEEEIEHFLDNEFEDFLTENYLEEAKRMSASSPRELIQRGLGHVETSWHSGSNGEKKRSLSADKAQEILTKHVEKDHGKMAGKAYRLTLKHSTHLGNGFFNGQRQADLENAVVRHSKKTLGNYVSKNAKGKIKFEEFDETGLTEENLMEMKMKLKPGQKMTPKMFAKMKADVLAKQKDKAAKKAAPKPEPKEEKVENDDNNRNAQMLKGKYPWGSVSNELNKTAMAKIKQIQKPNDRLKALNAVWADQKHFHSIVKHGHLNGATPADKEDKPKSKVTLAPVRGVNT